MRKRSRVLTFIKHFSDAFMDTVRNIMYILDYFFLVILSDKKDLH